MKIIFSGGFCFWRGGRSGGLEPFREYFLKKPVTFPPPRKYIWKR
jgi:hypothetical protein